MAAVLPFGPFVFDLHFAASTAGVGFENRGALNAGQCTGGAPIATAWRVAGNRKTARIDCPY